MCMQRTHIAGKVRQISYNILRVQKFFAPTELFCENGRATQAKLSLQRVPVYIPATLFPLVCANLEATGKNVMNFYSIRQYNGRF